jgi:two-component system chemotaxis response regulator CheV
MAKEQGILLEAGTNEMELLVFRLGDTPFGVNVAKVREIIQRVNTTLIPYAPPSIVGSFKLRDQVLTLVNLGSHFNMQGEETLDGKGMIVIVEFNNCRCGILVDSVERIHRLKWDDIHSPSQYLLDMEVPITGVVNIEDRIVLVADFESIVGEILGVEGAVIPEDDVAEISPKDIHLILADDSSVIRASLLKILHHYGYEDVTVCTDGQQAWDMIEETRDSCGRQFDLVLSDIEMPRMDGLHLTSRIKNDPQLKEIPVVLFSSLITADNIRKGQSVGADAQVSKPDSDEMIRAIEDCLAGRCVTA